MKRQQIIEALFETMDVAKRTLHGRMQIVLGDSTLSRTQLELLFTIKYHQPIAAKQLAQKLQLTPGAISQLVDELDKQAMIERHTDPADRRRHVLRVSSAGQLVLKQLEKKRRHLMENVMKDLSDDELATWLRIQQKMISEFQTLQQPDQERSKP